MPSLPKRLRQFVKITDFDLRALLGDPPADDSAEHKAEFDLVLKYQAERTAEQVQCRQKRRGSDGLCLLRGAGSLFNPKRSASHCGVSETSYTDTKAVSAGAKLIWNRQRPPFVDSRIKPCVEVEKTGSFPSGHATRGVVWATVLGEIFPDQKAELMRRGKLIGEDRLIGGVHFPSDVAAGQKLGAAIAAKMLANPQFKVALQQAQAECIAAHKP